MDAASGALHAELSNRPMGWRVDTESGTSPGRSARDRKPPRDDRPSGEPVVCAFARGGQRPTSPIVADEEHGEVWFGALAWSGSWRITVEKTQLDAVRVTGGFNPFDFGYKLKPGEHLETPIFYGGYSESRPGRRVTTAAQI